MQKINELIKNKIMKNEAFSADNNMTNIGREETYNYHNTTGEDFHVVNVKINQEEKSRYENGIAYDETVVIIEFTASFDEFNNIFCWEEVTVQEFCDIISTNFVDQTLDF